MVRQHHTKNMLWLPPRIGWKLTEAYTSYADLLSRLFDPGITEEEREKRKTEAQVWITGEAISDLETIHAEIYRKLELYGIFQGEAAEARELARDNFQRKGAAHNKADKPTLE
jgi:hypothetical protein